MTRTKILILAAAASILPPALTVSPAAAQGVGTRYQYAAKIVCGRSLGTSPAARGLYFTSVNVHNPREPIEFRRKVAIALPGEAGKVTPLVNSKLAYDEAMQFDCAQMARMLAAAGIPNPGFFEGFLVVMGQHELDVVAVYTAAPALTGQVATMHTERVPVRDRNNDD